jgi:hypothetical protein
MVTHSVGINICIPTAVKWRRREGIVMEEEKDEGPGTEEKEEREGEGRQE